MATPHKTVTAIFLALTLCRSLHPTLAQTTTLATTTQLYSSTEASDVEEGNRTTDICGRANPSTTDYGKCIETFVTLLNPNDGRRRSRLTRCFKDFELLTHLNVEEFFPSPKPGEVAYQNGFGFRGFDQPCSLEAEEYFYEQFLNITKKMFPETEKKTDDEEDDDDKLASDYVPEEFLARWAALWTDFVEGTTKGNTTMIFTGKDICNPRWMLQCGKETRTCVCLHAGFRELNLHLERENIVDEVCSDEGVCAPPEHIHSDENPNTKYSGFRCVASDFQLYDDYEDDIIALSACEFNWLPFGTCVLDCNSGYDCKAIEPTSLKGYNEKFKNLAVCCHEEDGCVYDQDKGGASALPKIMTLSGIVIQETFLLLSVLFLLCIN